MGYYNQILNSENLRFLGKFQRFKFKLFVILCMACCSVVLRYFRKVYVLK